MNELHVSEGRKFPLHDRDRHVLNVLVELAEYSHGAPAALPRMSHSTGYNLSYLERVVTRFRRHGIVKSVRGVRGGYLIARSPDKITVAEILAAGGELVARGERYDGSRFIVQVDALFASTKAIRLAILARITLADLLKDRAAAHPFLSNKLSDFKRSRAP